MKDKRILIFELDNTLTKFRKNTKKPCVHKNREDSVFVLALLREALNSETHDYSIYIMTSRPVFNDATGKKMKHKTHEMFEIFYGNQDGEYYEPIYDKIIEILYNKNPGVISQELTGIYSDDFYLKENSVFNANHTDNPKNRWLYYFNMKDDPGGIIINDICRLYEFCKACLEIPGFITEKPNKFQLLSYEIDSILDDNDNEYDGFFELKNNILYFMELYNKYINNQIDSIISEDEFHKFSGTLKMLQLIEIVTLNNYQWKDIHFFDYSILTYKSYEMFCKYIPQMREMNYYPDNPDDISCVFDRIKHEDVRKRLFKNKMIDMKYYNSHDYIYS